MIALSIIIVNYKTSEFLRNCLTAIYQSNTPFTYEIIVVDNSSAEEELESIVEQFPKLTLIENSQNVGFVRANNQGIEIAKGEFVLFLNPDTEVRHDAISFMANYLRQHPGVGAVGPLLLNTDGTPQASYFHFPNFISVVMEHYLSNRVTGILELPSRDNRKERNVDVIRGACLMTRKSLLNIIGGMNEHLYMYSEETDLCYKLKNILSFYNVFLPQAVVIHHEQKSMKRQKSSFVVFHYFRSKFFFFRDNYSPLKAKLFTFLIMGSLKLKSFMYKLLGHREKYNRFESLYRQLRCWDEPAELLNKEY